MLIYKYSARPEGIFKYSSKCNEYKKQHFSSGWIECKQSNEFLRGLYYGGDNNTNNLNNILRIKCCTYQDESNELYILDRHFDNSWLRILDHPNSWANIPINSFMTGFYIYESSDCRWIGCIDAVHYKYIYTVKKNRVIKTTNIASNYPSNQPSKYPSIMIKETSINPTSIPTYISTYIQTTLSDISINTNKANVIGLNNVDGRTLNKIIIVFGLVCFVLLVIIISMICCFCVFQNKMNKVMRNQKELSYIMNLKMNKYTWEMSNHNKSPVSISMCLYHLQLCIRILIHIYIHYTYCD